MNPSEYQTELVHISEITEGDTIFHFKSLFDKKGEVKTVCKNNISRNGFMGSKTLFGSSYRLGLDKVIRFKTNNVGCLVAIS